MSNPGPALEGTTNPSVVTGGVNGTKVGNATTEVVGFYGVTGVAQPAPIANCTVAADGTSAGTQLNLLLAQLRLLGIIAT